MHTDEHLSVKIAQGVRILHGFGLIEVWGHVSARADHQSCYILGHLHSEGRLLSGARPDSIVRVDLDGQRTEGTHHPPGEVYIHTEVYKKRPDVKAVVHHHGLSCITLSILDQQVLPLWVQATPFCKGTPIFELPEQVDNPEIAAEVAHVLGDKRAVLLKGHGAVVVGASIEEACVLSICMERTARMQLDALMAGPFKPIPPEALINGMTRGLSLSELVDSWWDYGKAKYPLYGVESNNAR